MITVLQICGLGREQAVARIFKGEAGLRRHSQRLDGAQMKASRSRLLGADIFARDDDIEQAEGRRAAPMSTRSAPRH